MKIRRILVVMFVVVLMSVVAVALSGCKDKDELGEEPPVAIVQTLEYKLNNDNTYSVIGIGSADKLEKIEIPEAYEGKSVTGIAEKAFIDCINLKSLKIPVSVKYIGRNALEGCNNLASLILPFLGSSSDDIPNATLSYLFGDGNIITNLKKVVLAGGNIGEKAFYQSESIENITISDGIDKIGNYAFYGCINLESIVLSNSVKNIGNNAFEGCSKLKSIDIPAGVGKIGDYAFKNCIGMQMLTIEEGVREIGKFAFEQCSNLAEILVPDSVTSIGVSAFLSCVRLKNVVIGKGLTTIENSVFSGAKALEILQIGANVTKIGLNAFSGCGSLKKLSLPESVTEIENMAFVNCTGLEEINVDEQNSTFKGEGNCLIKGNVLILGCKTSVIPNGVVRIKENAFKNCEGLTNINIPSSVQEISNQAFVGCVQLENFVVDSQNTKYRTESNFLIEIDSAYGDILVLAGNSVYSVRIIPNTISIIGENSFQNCGNLTKIDIPSSITEIKSNAFSNCSSLAEITYEGTKEDWINVYKEDSWCNFENSTIIICTDGKLDQFENELE